MSTELCLNLVLPVRGPVIWHWAESQPLFGTGQNLSRYLALGRISAVIWHWTEFKPCFGTELNLSHYLALGRISAVIWHWTEFKPCFGTGH